MNNQTDTQDALSDDDILDCFAAVKASGQASYLVSVGRAIEAKCRTLRAGQSEPVAPYCWQECEEDGTPRFDEGTFSDDKNAFDYSRPLYLGPTVPDSHQEQRSRWKRNRPMSAEFAFLAGLVCGILICGFVALLFYIENRATP